MKTNNYKIVQSKNIYKQNIIMILSKYKVLCDPRREINSIWRRGIQQGFIGKWPVVELWRLSHWPLGYLRSIVSVAIFIIFPFHTSHLSQTHISDSLEHNNWFYHSSAVLPYGKCWNHLLLSFPSILNLVTVVCEVLNSWVFKYKYTLFIIKICILAYQSANCIF